MFLLDIVVLVVFAKIFSELAERAGLPSILGEFSTGLVFGATFLALIHPGEIATFAIMGVILLLFMAGYEESDISRVLKEKKKILGTALVALGTILASIFLISFYILGLNMLQSFFLALIFGLTDIAVGVKTLLGIKRLDTPIGKSLLEVAVIDTLLGLFLLAGVVIAASGIASPLEILFTIGKIGLFFTILYGVGRFVPTIIKYSEKMETEEAQFAIALSIIFFLAFLAEHFGLASILGAFFAGIFLARPRELPSHQFYEKVKALSYGFFVPLFFAWMGLRVSLLNLPQVLNFVLILVPLALIPKLVASSVYLKAIKVKTKEALAIGAGLLPRGADNVIVLALALELGIFGVLGEAILTTLFVVMLASMIITPLCLKILLK